MSIPYDLPQHPAQTYATHVPHPAYAPPPYRPPSPASSVGTAYPADQTSLSDSESFIEQSAFESKQERIIGLGKQREEEMQRESEVLVLVPDRPPPLQMFGDGERERPAIKMIRATDRPLEPWEEKSLFERVMRNLRAEVAALQENEMFERILQRTQEEPPPPATQDIDTLMRSMMGGMSIRPGSTEDWSIGNITRSSEDTRTITGDPAPSMTSTPAATVGGKRSRNGTRRRM
ncbi:hypothetical protein D9613_005567 [Agrocybe pediades]|uniref:Uncharacterized protein n=1 Tax=Agrocybe pediades TaxID=84607 RepID=A0A8H4QXW4_9AGAR|nr:hypothetical protein D9613_005567 [Agrocybe pediades]